MNALENKQYSEYTKYPRIFKNVYWGNFTLSTTNDTISYKEEFIELCNNRNYFVEEYNITKIHNKPSRKIRDKILEELYPWHRHIEYYKSNDNKTIVIFSKFVENENEHESYLNKGYNIIPSVYAPNENTYVKYC